MPPAPLDPVATVDPAADPHLRSPAHRVSRRAIGYWALRIPLKWTPVVVVQVAWWLLDGGHANMRWALAIATAVLVVAHSVIEPHWRYRVHRWETTRTAVYTQSGWVTQERRIAPLSRVQTVDLERGPLQRLFSLAEVTVTTASAAGPLEIVGLDRSVAEQLVRDLVAAADTAPDDAT